ncbi:DUF305 domain-containing protein [Moraxella sp. FZLJ2107]|uniref:CopM family metallochaperone n=1 Tax=unclassified Moraxella TaxID=2685852 RepID=UPI00209C21EA|nr:MULTISPECIES: DUF305 domain-containing protein [unclassified Moraxella]USZ15741.1 DUF305 domain-containing protein [Moraxella sp. FZFQ2102]UTO04459.1 DUF305 domain-containing protein [Moraxella sp. FZLJ2107]UTO23292.1 DUF305 domain-containing protein [Moraxella sp. FZLJ2109]
MTRLSAILMTSAALLLTACNQSNEQSTKPADSQAATTEQSSTMPMDHAHHSADAAMPPHAAAYMQSMNTMHDAMVVAAKSANADVAFAKGMIPHHQGAIEMAKIQLEYGKDDAMRKLAQDIIDAQGMEIEFMQNWLSTAKDADRTDETSDHAKAYLSDMALHERMMAGVHHADADAAFVLGMIPHHQSAIEMAKIELQYGTDDQMRNLAQGIIDAQDPEITLMQNWLKSKNISE